MINEILQHHDQFASLMARRIGHACLMAQWFDDASISRYYLQDDDLETTRLAQNIRRASASLAVIVEQIKYELRAFVFVLRKEVTVPLAKRVATSFATLSPSVSGTLHHHPYPKKPWMSCDSCAPGSRLAETALERAASEFCRVASGAF